MDKIITRIRSMGKRFYDAHAPPEQIETWRPFDSIIMEDFSMNECYLVKLQEDLRLKNFTKNTCDDYYRFTKRFLEFTGKDAMSITYTDIRRFIFHMKDMLTYNK